MPRMELPSHMDTVSLNERISIEVYGFESGTVKPIWVTMDPNGQITTIVQEGTIIESPERLKRQAYSSFIDMIVSTAVACDTLPLALDLLIEERSTTRLP